MRKFIAVCVGVTLGALFLGNFHYSYGQVGGTIGSCSPSEVFTNTGICSTPPAIRPKVVLKARDAPKKDVVSLAPTDTTEADTTSTTALQTLPAQQPAQLPAQQTRCSGGRCGARQQVSAQVGLSTLNPGVPIVGTQQVQVRRSGCGSGGGCGSAGCGSRGGCNRSGRRVKVTVRGARRSCA